MMHNFAQTWKVSVPPEKLSRLALTNDGKDQRVFLDSKEQPQELSRSPEFTPLRFRRVNKCVKFFPKSAKRRSLCLSNY